MNKLLKSCIPAVVAGIVPLAHAESPRARSLVDLEWGAALQERNEVQSPNSSAGTRFALDSLTGEGPFSAPRFQITLPLNPRDDLRLLAAPLRIRGDGALDSALNFEGASLAPGAASARYRFDSYRVTWRRTVGESDLWVLKAGLTGKVRDAEISLQQGAITARRSDIGFVPLLHVHAQRSLGEGARLIMDADGLASGRGRAFDLSARYALEWRPGLSVFAGIRILDGGADNEAVYNFARFNYLTFGLTFRGP